MKGALTLLCAATALSGCSGCNGGVGDGGSDAGDGGSESLSVVPAAATIDASGQPITFRAILGNPSEPVFWALSPAVGALSAPNSALTLYTPPASVNAPVLVTLTASTGSSSAQAAITVDPGGTLLVDVSAPALVAPSISVAGPNNFQRTIAATVALSGVDPGVYTVTALEDRIPQPLADVIEDGIVTGSPATVANGGSATVSVTYSQRVGTGVLWIPAPAFGHVAGYGVGALLGDGGVTLLGALSRPASLAFDGRGNLWVADTAARTLNRFPSGHLVAMGMPDSSFGDADAGFLSDPVSLAFDAAGDLWVADRSSRLVHFTAAALAGPAPLPVADATDPIGGPADLAFDGFGDLWVSHPDAGVVAEFTGVGQWSGTLTAAPAQTLTALPSPLGLAFDRAGNLWVALADAGAVAEFPALVGSPGGVSGDAGAVLLGVQADAGTHFAHPSALAFDDNGNLWLSTSDGVLLEYAQPQALAGAVGPGPATTVSNAEWTAGGKLAIDPPPANLPLRQ